MEGVIEASFMSERASLFWGSIGFLGEYCPTLTKGNIHSLERVDCMHLEPFQEYLHFGGCYCKQPLLTLKDQSFESRKVNSQLEDTSDFTSVSTAFNSIYFF